jgi:hypothetical protein
LVVLPRHQVRTLGAVVALALWVPATVFFATIGLLVTREVLGRASGPTAPIADVRGALVTAAYSLGGAAIGLGLAWLVLPRTRGRGLGVSATLWIAATVLLLATRRVSGWTLLVAAVVATGIGIDVIRRLVLAVIAAWRHEPASSGLQR